MPASRKRKIQLNQPYGLPVERLNGGQPIIAPTQHWWEDGVTFNPAAIYLPPTHENAVLFRALLPMRDPADPDLADGVVVIHYRAAPEQFPGSSMVHSFIGLALFTPDLKPLYRYKEPVLSPSPDPDGFDALGVEDPRVMRFGDTFYMIYCGLSRETDPDQPWRVRARLCLATSKDLLHWEKQGVMLGDPAGHANKDGVLFPERIDGKYYLLHRPFDSGMAQAQLAVWLAASDRLEGPWQNCGEILRAFPNPRMRSSWVGAGSVPVAVGEKRYIEIYHTGNYINEADREYDLDAALLDFNHFDPAEPGSLVVARLEPLMVPETPAELRSRSQHQVGNVLFACGSYEYQGYLYIIYGGADTYTLAARVEMRRLLQALENSGLGNPFSAA